MQKNEQKNVIKIKLEKTEIIFENPKLKDYLFLLIHNVIIHVINMIFTNQ